MVSFLLTFISQGLANATYNKEFWLDQTIELGPEIHDHQLAKTMKEKTAFEVNQDEMDRIDKILQSAQKMRPLSGLCTCLTKK